VSYVDTTAVNGTTYYYTVAVRDVADTENLSLYNDTGVSVSYYRMPTLVSLENTSNGAKLTWHKVDGIGTYRVYKKTGNQSWTALTTVTDTTYTDAEVLSTGSYWYTVCCMLGDKEVSAYNGTGLNTIFFWNPALLSGPTVGNGTLAFSWDVVAGVSTYTVERKVGNGSWTTLTTQTSRSFTDGDVVSGKTYTYRVYCDDSGTRISGASTTSSFVYLGVPTLTATPGARKATLSWSKPAGATGYRIYRKRSLTSWTLIKEIDSGNTRTYVDKELDGNTTYYYMVVATASGGNSANGPEVRCDVH